MSLTSETGGFVQPAVLPKFQAGVFYTVSDLTGQTGAGLVAASAWIKDRIYSYAFPICQTATLASLRVLTNAGHTELTAKILLAIYADNNGRPGAKLLTAGELTMAAASTAYAATVSLAVRPGIYWLAMTSSHGDGDGNDLVATSPPGGGAAAPGMPLGVASVAAGVGAGYHLIATRTYDSTIPDPHPSGTLQPTGLNLPAVWFEFA